MSKLILPVFVVLAFVAGTQLGGANQMTGKASDRARETAGEAHVVDRDGRSIEYFTMGEGPVVLLIASAGREASDFNELASELVSAGFRTLAIEPPGIGGSDLPGEGAFDLFDLADDLAHILDQEDGAELVFAIGHAFGNRVVRAFATKYPQRVEALILIASGGAKPVPEKANEALFACFDDTLSPADHLANVRYGFFADGNDIPNYWRRGWHGATATLQGRATGALDPAEWTSAGGRPILVLQAANDTIAPPEIAGKPIKAADPDRVELVIVPNAGHALLPEQPVMIAEQVIGYLKSHR